MICLPAGFVSVLAGLLAVNLALLLYLLLRPKK